MHHTEKQSQFDKFATNRNRYTGYPYPSNKMGILEHKRNTDEIQAKEGFMVALRYNIQIRTNTFAHRVTLADRTNLVANISILQEKVWNTCYTTARRFNKLEFEDVNPDTPGEAREDWDPTTGNKRQTRKAPTGLKTASQAEAGPSSNAKPAAAKAPKQSGYKGSNFDLNYSQRYREQGQTEKRNKKRREPRK
ncbi:hypothetical protein PCASD_11529 [Puccinia coronata f. sp. avenae]|uniref:Uncharacterized protein n=1 Tax=Puccinia coronata f. sp. avenae TaxID=200324 RepID=A0A2N5ULT4_9BASI|nr:hypothetical protein PCASD_11529 [Puccinia coronata f. sp. avenae]